MTFEDYTVALVVIDGCENLVKPSHTVLRLGLRPLFDEQGIRIGRLMSNDIVVPQPTVSQRHAKVYEKVENDSVEYYLCDTGSANGTFVNGVKITNAYRLRSGDVIGLGPNYIELLEFVVETPEIADPTIPDVAGDVQPTVGNRLKYVRGEFKLDDKILDLSMLERRFMLHLYQHTGEWCDYTDCADAVWGKADTELEGQSLKNLKWQLCKKLGEGSNDPEETKFILTRRSRGYRLVVNPLRKSHPLRARMKE